jgi:hypothetical protein
MWQVSNGGINRKIVSCAAVLALLAAVGALVAGCGQSTADKQKQYKTEYQEIINDFQAQVAKDDAKAAQLSQNNDLTGLIKLNNRRMNNVNATFDELLYLYPPADLRRIQAETLYYLTAVGDQIEAQNAYLEAVLAGKPTADLESIASNASAKSQALGSELALDLQKANIKIKSAPANPQGQPQSAPSSTSPGGGAP